MLTPLPHNLRGDEMTEKIEQSEAGLASDLKYAAAAQDAIIDVLESNFSVEV